MKELAEIIEVDSETSENEVFRKAGKAIEAGELVVYPTETVYGLGADATSDEAVAEVFKAKSRPLEEPVSVAVDSLSMAYRVGKLDHRAEEIIQELMPGPLTVVVEERPLTSDLLTAGTGRIGIRIPDHPTALGLVKYLGRPITSTSANLSGHSNPFEVGDALNQLGEEVSLALDSGECSGKEPSTVVDLAGEIDVLREGPISESRIRKVVR